MKKIEWKSCLLLANFEISTRNSGYCFEWGTDYFMILRDILFICRHFSPLPFSVPNVMFYISFTEPGMAGLPGVWMVAKWSSQMYRVSIIFLMTSLMTSWWRQDSSSQPIEPQICKYRYSTYTSAIFTIDFLRCVFQVWKSTLVLSYCSRGWLKERGGDGEGWVNTSVEGEGEDSDRREGGMVRAGELWWRGWGRGM